MQGPRLAGPHVSGTTLPCATSGDPCPTTTHGAMKVVLVSKQHQGGESRTGTNMKFNDLGREVKRSRGDPIDRRG
jgi:hypothetical protein